jgi:hypothetical protein
MCLCHKVIRCVKQFDEHREARHLHCLELFAGVGNIAAAFRGDSMFEPMLNMSASRALVRMSAVHTYFK